MLQFLSTRHISATEIDRQISEVYYANAMREAKVRKWGRDFINSRDYVDDNARSGPPSRSSKDLVASVEQKIRDNRRFAITAHFISSFKVWDLQNCFWKLKF